MSKDCNNDLNYFDADCDYYASNKATDAFKKRKTFCNLNRLNAYSSNCIRFCNVNRSECSLKNLYDTCKNFNIPDSDCNQETIDKLRNKCLKYKIINENNKLQPGAPPCNDQSIKSFENDCNTYNFTLDTCNVLDVNKAKEMSMILNQQQQTQEMMSQISNAYLEYSDSQLEKVNKLFEESQSILMTAISESDNTLPPDDSYKLGIAGCTIIVFIGFIAFSSVLSKGAS
jgi:hypothetical protein